MSRTIEKKRAKVSTFLVTLRQMLNNQPPQYITWYGEQNQFKIKNPSRFSEEVLPKYFKHSNLSSFVRQLNIYDFKKISNQKYPDEYIYFHPYFDKNKPELMNNIYRKVHHLPLKNHKYSHQSPLFSQNSQQNSITEERRRLRQEIEKLESKLEQIQSINSIICEENIKLQGNLPIVKNLNAQSSKYLYKILMQSYEVQYRKFAEKINSQLVEQSLLLNEVYERQRILKYQSASNYDKNSNVFGTNKSKLDATNYNSTSSGGSMNGHSQKQNESIRKKQKDKQMTKGVSNNRSLFKEQDQFSVKQNGEKKIQKQNSEKNLQQASSIGQKGKEGLKHQWQRRKKQERHNGFKKIPSDQEQHSLSEHQSQCHPSRCVIDLRNRRDEEHRDVSRMYKAIVLNPNHTNGKDFIYKPMTNAS